MGSLDASKICDSNSVGTRNNPLSLNTGLLLLRQPAVSSVWLSRGRFHLSDGLIESKFFVPFEFCSFTVLLEAENSTELILTPKGRIRYNGNSKKRHFTAEVKMSDKKKSDDYSADKIQHLEGIEGIRHRPAMYIGGTDLSGLHHLIYEVTDNVLDEYANGYATVMNVKINGDGSVTVSDDGRGIPVDMMKDKGKPAIEVVFTEIHA